MEAENALLKERKTKLDEEISKNLKIMEDDLKSRTENAEEALTKFEEGQTVFEAELNKKGDFEQEAAQAREFCAKFEEKVAAVENRVAGYEKIVQDSMRDFEEPLKKIEKVG